MGFWSSFWSRDKSGDLGQNLGEKAVLLKKNGDLNGALIALMEQEEYYRNQCPESILSLVSSFGRSASTREQRENLINAAQIANFDGELDLHYVTIAHIARSLANQAAILIQLSRRGEADGRLTQALSLAAGIGNKDLTNEIEVMRKGLGLEFDPRL